LKKNGPRLSPLQNNLCRQPAPAPRSTLQERLPFQSLSHRITFSVIRRERSPAIRREPPRKSRPSIRQQNRQTIGGFNPQENARRFSGKPRPLFVLQSLVALASGPPTEIYRNEFWSNQLETGLCPCPKDSRNRPHIFPAHYFSNQIYQTD